jgi:hypothetical protein
MKQLPMSQPPRSQRRPNVHLDNVAVVPASLLPFREHWQAIANGLPRGGILIVLPDHAKQQRVAQAVASQFRKRGQRVRVIDRASSVSAA